jgi:serine/threonine protein kinase
MTVYETFGKYKLTERLAFGGMAEVFLATIHGEAGFVKPVVIKRLHPRLSEDNDFVQMLIDEARITAQLIHGNICQVLDLGAVDNSYYIAMEFISGEDVRTLQDHCMRRRMPLSVEAATHIVCELLNGLDYAHRKEGPDGKPLGIIHRDISPQNVLISYEGEVKIIDFGIAKARSRMVQTQAGVIKGKFRYMSPEQASGELIDQRTDIFAAGVVLYELLRGSPHSVELSDTEVLRRMRRAEFDPLLRQRPDLPPSIDQIVRKALQRRPRDRFTTAAEFRNKLLQATQQLGLSFGRSELAVVMQQVFDMDRRRRRSGSFAGTMEQVRRGSGTGPPSVRVGRGQSSAASPPRSPRVATDRMARDDGSQKAAWVAYAPTTESTPGRQLSSPGVEPMELNRTVARDTADEMEQGQTSAFYPLSEEDLEVADSSVPTASMDKVGASARRPHEPPSREPTDVLDTDERERGGRRPSGALEKTADLHRQSTDIRAKSEQLHRESTNILAARAMGSDVIGFGKRRRSADDDQQATTAAPIDGSSPAATGLFTEQGTSTRQRPPAKPSIVLRTVVGVIIVLVLGSGLALALYLLEKPLGSSSLPDQGRPRIARSADGGTRPDVAASRRPPRARAGLLKLRSKPPGARIVLCGKDSGQVTPATLQAEVGKACSVELELEGYETYRNPVTPQSGQPITIVATLRRTAGTARRGSGTLKVTSIQVGTVYVDGQAVGRTPQVTVQLAPGVHSVKMHFPTLEVQTPARQVTIQVGRTSSLHFDPQ